MTRAEMAAAIVERMRAAYEAEGIEGDFADAERYLCHEATLDELRADYERWVNKARD